MEKCIGYVLDCAVVNLVNYNSQNPLPCVFQVGTARNRNLSEIGGRSEAATIIFRRSLVRYGEGQTQKCLADLSRSSSSFTLHSDHHPNCWPKDQQQPQVNHQMCGYRPTEERVSQKPVHELSLCGPTSGSGQRMISQISLQFQLVYPLQCYRQTE